jgi:hypothetical protein
MSKTIFTAAALLLCALSGCRGGGAQAEGNSTDALFDPTLVRRVDVTIPTDNGPPSSWELIDRDSEGQGCVAFTRPYHEGAVKMAGKSYTNVGVKVKGGCGSSSSLGDKPSLKIHLSWDADPEDDTCVAERRILGVERLTLNNGRQDGTALHEHLTYKFYRMVGVPAPRTASVVLYLNDEYYGVYQLIETIDRQFLKEHFDTSAGRGAMYEGAYHCDLLTGDDIEMSDGHCWEREFELDSCSRPPEPGDDLQFEADGVTPQDGWIPLRDFRATVESIAAEDSFFPAITQTVEWGEFLANWAASSIVYDWDNYAQFQNNFRVYHNPSSGQWHFIPWGVDQSWIAEQPGGGEDPRIRFGILDPTGDLARLCFEATGVDSTGRTCTELYIAELYRQLRIFERFDWDAEIDAWVERLTPHLDKSDPHRGYSLGDWEANIGRLRSFARGRVADVRDELLSAGFAEP